MDSFRLQLARAWRHEKAVSARWWQELPRTLAEHVGKRVFGVVVAAAGAIVLGHSLDGVSGAMVGLLMLAAGLFLWGRTTAQAAIHAEQEAQIESLQPKQVASESAPRAIFYAHQHHQGHPAGSFYEVSYSRVDAEIASGRGELVTDLRAAELLVEAIEDVCALIDTFPASPPTYGNYYPHRGRERKQMAQSLKRLREALAVAERLDPTHQWGSYDPVQQWEKLLMVEFQGQGRLEQYQDRALHLRRWADECRAMAARSSRQ